MKNLVENMCIEWKVETVSQVSKLLASQESLTKEMEELRIVLVEKDTKRVHLKL